MLLTKAALISFRPIYFLPFIFPLLTWSQSERSNEQDYKDSEQFKDFHKKRKVVAEWQIVKLKAGALVVILNDRSATISKLAQTDVLAAEKKRLETLAVNCNIYKAYHTQYTFSKLYFIDVTSVNDLLNGSRSKIFLDSTLRPNPIIAMVEDFYLLAEEDYLYNSSIGFVAEKDAKNQKETGSANSTIAFVLKNKYRHQLKKPFPFYSYGIMPSRSYSVDTLMIDGIRTPFNVGVLPRDTKEAKFPSKMGDLTLSFSRQHSYQICANRVLNLNKNLFEFSDQHPNYPPDHLLQKYQEFLY